MILALALGLAGVACIVVFAGARKSAATVSIEDRLAHFSDRQYTLEELELALPFSQRVLTPFFLRVARSVSRFTPRSNTEKIRTQLIEAGSPSKLGVAEFIGLKIVLSGLSGGFVFLLMVLSGGGVLRLIGVPAARRCRRVQDAGHLAESKDERPTEEYSEIASRRN